MRISFVWSVCGPNIPLFCQSDVLESTENVQAVFENKILTSEFFLSNTVFGKLPAKFQIIRLQFASGRQAQGGEGSGSDIIP